METRHKVEQVKPYLSAMQNSKNSAQDAFPKEKGCRPVWAEIHGYTKVYVTKGWKTNPNDTMNTHNIRGNKKMHRKAVGHDQYTLLGHGAQPARKRVEYSCWPSLYQCWYPFTGPSFQSTSFNCHNCALSR